MNIIQRCVLFGLLTTLITACSPINHLEEWKDDTYSQSLEKVLVICIAREGYIRNQFENVLSHELKSRGVEAIQSYKVLPGSGDELDREVVLKKVRELRLDSVLVVRSIMKESFTTPHNGGEYLSPTAIDSDGWSNFHLGTVDIREMGYSADYFTVATKLFDVKSQKQVWSYVSQIKIEGSNQAAVNLFIPELVKQMEKNQLLK